MPTVTGDEDALRFIDPDLFDARVVEVSLQGAKPRDPGNQLIDDLVGVAHRPHHAAQAALIVRPHGGPRKPAYGLDIGQRVDAASAHLLADVEVERVDD